MFFAASVGLLLAGCGTSGLNTLVLDGHELRGVSSTSTAMPARDSPRRSRSGLAGETGLRARPRGLGRQQGR